MELPALSGCPGKPACDGDVSLCDDHKDVVRAILAERERCAKIAEAVAAGWRNGLENGADKRFADLLEGAVYVASEIRASRA